MLQCSQEVFPWAVNLLAALCYVTHNRVCVVSIHFSECAGKKKVHPTESLIICSERIGTGFTEAYGTSTAPVLFLYFCFVWEHWEGWEFVQQSTESVN